MAIVPMISAEIRPTISDITMHIDLEPRVNQIVEELQAHQARHRQEQGKNTRIMERTAQPTESRDPATTLALMVPGPIMKGKAIEPAM